MLNLDVKRALYSHGLKTLTHIMALCTTCIVLFLVGAILVQAIPHLNLDIILSKPSYLTDTIGILPDILNTIYIIATALFLVIPLGVGAAIYLTEYAKNKRLVLVIEYAIETLAGIPSIIYGLCGMLIFINILSLKTSLLAGALTLVVMSIPTIIRTTQESLKTVSQSYKEGAYALGANKFYVIRTIILPCSLDGIISACILSVGRMLGESAALLFTAGFAHNLNNYFDAINQSGATLTVALYVYAKEQGEFEVAFVIAFILLVMSFILNLIAKAFAHKLKK